MRKNLTEIVFILDRSGSMSGLEQDTIGGFNPMIKYPMGDILYEEKIMGSIHFTPGCCYKDCDNGNKSSIHWDLVLIQREDYGGGCIYFDHRLIRKDGIFVLDELKKLN